MKYFLGSCYWDLPKAFEFYFNSVSALLSICYPPISTLVASVVVVDDKKVVLEYILIIVFFHLKQCCIESIALNGSININYRRNQMRNHNLIEISVKFNLTSKNIMLSQVKSKKKLRFADCD